MCHKVEIMDFSVIGWVFGVHDFLLEIEGKGIIWGEAGFKMVLIYDVGKTTYKHL